MNKAFYYLKLTILIKSHYFRIMVTKSDAFDRIKRLLYTCPEFEPSTPGTRSEQITSKTAFLCFLSYTVLEINWLGNSSKLCVLVNSCDIRHKTPEMKSLIIATKLKKNRVVIQYITNN